MLIIVLLSYIGSMLIPIYFGVEIKGIVITVALLLGISLFTLQLFLNTTYKISDDHQLVIRCGIATFGKIDISSIKSVEKTNSIISSPAPSFDRIELKYDKWESVIISPKDKRGFIDALLKINPGIDVKFEVIN